MAGVLVDQGEIVVLSLLVNKLTLTENFILKLFKNNVTPGETNTEASFTVADFTGYANATLTGASFVATPGAPGKVQYAQVTFTSSATQAAQLIYGYHLVQATSGKALAAERFTDGPYTIQNNGDSISITVVITAD